MPESVTVREDAQVIQVNSWGEITIEDLQESLNAIVEIHRERGYKRILVDATREQSLPSTTQIFDFASQIAEYLSGMKLAVAISKRTQTDLQFIETVARNRGMQMTLHDSIDSALSWLAREPPGGDAYAQT